MSVATLALSTPPSAPATRTPIPPEALLARFGEEGCRGIVEAWATGQGTWLLRFEDGHREEGPAPGHEDPLVAARLVELLLSGTSAGQAG